MADPDARFRRLLTLVLAALGLLTAGSVLLFGHLLFKALSKDVVNDVKTDVPHADVGPPSVCGNGVVESGEACDLGKDNGDKPAFSKQSARSVEQPRAHLATCQARCAHRVPGIARFLSSVFHDVAKSGMS